MPQIGSASTLKRQSAPERPILSHIRGTLLCFWDRPPNQNKNKYVFGGPLLGPFDYDQVVRSHFGSLKEPTLPLALRQRGASVDLREDFFDGILGS